MLDHGRAEREPMDVIGGEEFGLRELDPNSVPRALHITGLLNHGALFSSTFAQTAPRILGTKVPAATPRGITFHRVSANPKTTSSHASQTDNPLPNFL